MKLSEFKSWVNRQVDKKLDKEPFSSLPLRMRIGIFMLLGCFIIGHGSTIFLLLIPGMNKQLSIGGLLSGSSIYIVCWFLGTIGLSLAGKDSIKYPIYFFAKLLKYLFPDFFKRKTDTE